MSDDVVLEMWTIYDHPRDMPDKFVARKWDITHGNEIATGEVLVCDELLPLRAEMLARGLTRLMRDPSDDPVIVETWI